MLFCDLDGTLIETISGDTFPKGIWDMKLRFDVLHKIKEIIKPEYILIVSNQGGIERGFVDRGHFTTKLNYICKSIEEYCNCSCYGTYCTTNNIADHFRKPNTGMLEHLAEINVGDDFDNIKPKNTRIIITFYVYNVYTNLKSEFKIYVDEMWTFYSF